MPSSTPGHKFLLDENVRTELLELLKINGFDVKYVPKGARDKKVAEISKTEDRILVTNDTDFEEYGKDQVFAIILLRIPQSDKESLLKSFQKLINDIDVFEGKLIMLMLNRWEQVPLFQEVEN